MGAHRSRGSPPSDRRRRHARAKDRDVARGAPELAVVRDGLVGVVAVGRRVDIVRRHPCLKCCEIEPKELGAGLHRDRGGVGGRVLEQRACWHRRRDVANEIACRLDPRRRDVRCRPACVAGGVGRRHVRLLGRSKGAREADLALRPSDIELKQRRPRGAKAESRHANERIATDEARGRRAFIVPPRDAVAWARARVGPRRQRRIGIDLIERIFVGQEVTEVDGFHEPATHVRRRRALTGDPTLAEGAEPCHRVDAAREVRVDVDGRDRVDGAVPDGVIVLEGATEDGERVERAGRRVVVAIQGERDRGRVARQLADGAVVGEPLPPAARDRRVGLVHRQEGSIAGVSARDCSDCRWSCCGNRCRRAG